MIVYTEKLCSCERRGGLSRIDFVRMLWPGYHSSRLIKHRSAPPHRGAQTVEFETSR